MSRAHELAITVRNGLTWMQSTDVRVQQSAALSELERLAADAERYREALERIASRGCHRFTSGSCDDHPGLLFDAPYGSDRECEACHARIALEAAA